MCLSLMTTITAFELGVDGVTPVLALFDAKMSPVCRSQHGGTSFLVSVSGKTWKKKRNAPVPLSSLQFLPHLSFYSLKGRKEKA